MTRQQNLFLIAHLCHITPTEVDELRVGDFAQIVAGIKQHVQAQQKEVTRG